MKNIDKKNACMNTQRNDKNLITLPMHVINKSGYKHFTLFYTLPSWQEMFQTHEVFECDRVRTRIIILHELK